MSEFGMLEFSEKAEEAWAGISGHGDWAGAEESLGERPRLLPGAGTLGGVWGNGVAPPTA
jgi:hypothetical protein